MAETTEPRNVSLTPALRELLQGIIDYAGIFPPAELRLREAIDNYDHYRHSPEAWMLGRFVIPAHRLDDLAPFATLFKDPKSPYSFSVLGQGGPDTSTFLTTFQQDLAAIEDFLDQHNNRLHADVMEVRLPPALLEADIATATDFFESVYRHLVAHGTAKLDIFYEVPLREATLANLPHLLAAMADHNSQRSLPARSEIGLKIRCGGMEPSEIPSALHLAQAITQCRDAGVRFKATAGLHHPIRHYDETMECMMHGFLNLFGGAVLAWVHDLAPGDLEVLLAEENPKRFTFAKDTFGWDGLTASLDDIHETRDRLAASFGSCSFDEPRDDLKELELM